RPYVAKGSAHTPRPNKPPLLRNSHPMGLAGRREASNAPRTPKATIGRSENPPARDSPFLTEKASPTATSTTHIAAKNQAIRAAVLSVTLDLPLRRSTGLCSRTPLVHRVLAERLPHPVTKARLLPAPRPL